MAAAAMSLLGVPTVSSLASTGQSSIMDYFNFDLQWFGLFLLAGGFCVPPFSFLGFTALNLYAVGSMTYFSVKSGLQAMLILATTYINAYYPKLWWLSYILVVNPWYVFDLVQMFSPAFAKEGFKLPIFHTPLGNGGTGKMTGSLMALCVGALSVGSYSLINMLPTEVQVSYKPILNTVFLTVGTMVTVAGGGITSMLVLPQVYTAIKSSLNEAKTAVSSVTIPPKATPAVSSTPVPPTQKGGGGIPSLGDIAEQISNGNIQVQSGGGADSSAQIFLGTLAVAALGGISLALIRSKAVSTV